MASSQARNFLRPNNLSGDLADGCVNNFISSLNKSRNRAMCVRARIFRNIMLEPFFMSTLCVSSLLKGLADADLVKNICFA